MNEIIEKLGGSSPLGPLEVVCRTIGEELGNFLDRSIDRIFEAINDTKK